MRVLPIVIAALLLAGCGSASTDADVTVNVKSGRVTMTLEAAERLIEGQVADPDNAVARVTGTEQT